MGSIRQACRFSGGVSRYFLAVQVLALFSSFANRRGVQLASKEFTMRFKYVGGLAMVAGLCFAAVAMGQAQGQPGQPGGRGRGGPPGGGGFPMFGGGGGGFGTSRLRLLQVDEIRKELELADEQVAAIRTL